MQQVATMVPTMQARAMALDRDALFPTDDFADLLACGATRASVPAEFGGSGWGTSPDGGAPLCALLRLVGQGNMAVGRLLEAHVNALKLLFRDADPALRQRVAHEVGQGALFGLWVTDPPDGMLRLREGRLSGRKQFCSGAGHVTRAVVTAIDPAQQVRLVHVRVGPEIVVAPLGAGLSGMRAATTRQAIFHDAPGTMFGTADAYLHEPDFSCGAWRTSAVTLGGLETLEAEMRRQLVARDRASDPHQMARIGQAQLAVESARLWMKQASVRAEQASGRDDVAYVGLARLAVERAGFEMIELAQRALGVAALMRGNPVERLVRDLATYLRQPAGDAVLTDAAEMALARTIPA